MPRAVHMLSDRLPRPRMKQECSCSGSSSNEWVSGKDSSADLKLETLDLSKKNLRYLSEDLYRSHPSVKEIFPMEGLGAHSDAVRKVLISIMSLHLEGNVLCSLPDDLFLHLPHLVWLDLRNNAITSLPRTIGRHRQLQYLLLEGNPIKELPIELGNLSTLKALTLRHCPLEFPPEDIVHKGLASILSFLRNFQKEDSASPEPELPPIEKLNLKELKSSMDLTGDWSSSEELKRFEMLKHKMEEKQMEEMLQNEPLTCHRKPQNARDRGNGTGWKFLTESRHAVPVERRKSEADRRADEKERLALVIQKQRNQEILKDWQKQTKLIQDQKAKGKKRTENPHEVPVPAPPFATDLDTSQHKNSREKQKSPAVEKQEMMPRVASVSSLKERASRDLRLEHRIKQHIQTMQERKKKPKRSVQEEMEAARKELEVASLLQAQLLQRKQEHDAAPEYRFTAFTGDISPSATSRGHQNVFATTP